MARGESSCTTSRAGRSLNHCRQFGLMTRTRNNIFWQALFSLFFALARISLTVFINVDCIRDIICVNYSRGLCGVMMTRGSQLLPRKARVHPQQPPSPPPHKHTRSISTTVLSYYLSTRNNLSGWEETCAMNVRRVPTDTFFNKEQSHFRTSKHL